MRPISIEEFNKLEGGRQCVLGKYEEELVSFLESDAPAAELETFGTKQPQVCYANIAKKKNYPVTIIGRGGRVFAICTEEDRVERLGGKNNWAKRIAYHVMGEEYELPDDIEETALDILSSVLDEKERDIVLMRFRDAATLEEIGVKYGVTRERARQILAKAHRKLYAIPLQKRWLIGDTEMKRIEEEMKNIRETHLKEMVDMIREKEATKYSSFESLCEWAENVPLEELGLSVRSFNCLMRYRFEKDGRDIKTIGDLLKQRYELGEDGFEEWLRSIRNMGRKCVEEVILKTDKFMERRMA